MIPKLNIRLLTFFAGIVAGGAAYGRRALDQRIEEQLQSEIDIAKDAAIAELERGMNSVITDKLISFATNLAIKAGLIGGAYLLYSYGHLTAAGLRIAVGVLVIAFITRDALIALPYAAPAWRVARRWGWDLRGALRDYVAGLAFERAYAAAFEAAQTGPNRRWIALSNYTAHAVSTEAAVAIAEVARAAPYGRVKWRALLGALFAAAMLAAYASFVLISAGQSS